MELKTTIAAFSKLGHYLNTESDELNAYIQKSCYENLWFTPENYKAALKEWSSKLQIDQLSAFISSYSPSKQTKNVGIIMAGNVPLVGFHDLLCTLLMGHTAIIKPSSEDKTMMELVVKKLISYNSNLEERLKIVETLPKDLDAVIATGSNNSFRYFEYYFRDKPHLLRKNRKSIAVLDGTESAQDLEALSTDIFSYFGLGCRNVSLVLLPKTMNITTVIDAFESQANIANHNKYANNYNYHKALFLMNKQEHLDNGFVLLKQELGLSAPIGCLFYSYYENAESIKNFVESNEEDIQCIVGKYYHSRSVDFGNGQSPELTDFADGKDTLHFLSEI